eukprot:3726539-Rhodomonas_salina.2
MAGSSHSNRGKLEPPQSCNCYSFFYRDILGKPGRSRHGSPTRCGSRQAEPPLIMMRARRTGNHARLTASDSEGSQSEGAG